MTAIPLYLFVIFLIVEGFAPWRAGSPGSPRWRANLALALINGVLLRALAALTPASIAALAQGAGVGLLHGLELPVPLGWCITFVALDLAVWWQHRALHEVPWLWRFHRVHHTDEMLDVTSAFRFHPLELAGSTLSKGLVAALLGAPPAAVLAFDVLLTAASEFTHANVRLPWRLEQNLGLVLVTPRIHRVHHSVRLDESRRNYGTLLSCWDRLFGRWRAPRQDDDTTLHLGVTGTDGPRRASLVAMLAEPVRSA
jgi:sterol desaturase/sphingolipid hydroxylase (fatty acid hydroxylase superfamily)